MTHSSAYSLHAGCWTLYRTDPLDPDYRVAIKYSVEVEGLTVYQETYDARKLAEELKADPDRVTELWMRRVRCLTDCCDRAGFSACLTHCLSEGECPRKACGP